MNEHPTPREILAATDVIAAAARAEMLPVAAYQIVGQVRLWVRLIEAEHNDAFARWADLALPWVAEGSPDWQNMRAAWDAGVKSEAQNG